MSRKISFLVNPISGNTKKDDILKLIRAEMQDTGIPFEFMYTNASGNYDELIDKISTDQITDVVMIGGDGTVNQVVSALRNEPIQFGILPFGSGNGLAFAAGIPKKPIEALSLILKGTAKFLNVNLRCIPLIVNPSILFPSLSKGVNSLNILIITLL